MTHFLDTAQQDVPLEGCSHNIVKSERKATCNMYSQLCEKNNMIINIQYYSHSLKPGIHLKQ